MKKLSNFITEHMYDSPNSDVLYRLDVFTKNNKELKDDFIRLSTYIKENPMTTRDVLYDFMEQHCPTLFAQAVQFLVFVGSDTVPETTDIKQLEIDIPGAAGRLCRMLVHSI
nr:MAG TPA: hypothetical protein [Caudoviricetes sp.]